MGAFTNNLLTINVLGKIDLSKGDKQLNKLATFVEKTMETNEIIKTRIETVLPMLNERQRRIYLSAESQSIGWGGKSKIAQLSLVTRRMIAKGETEVFVKDEDALKGRIRKEGGGRKKVIEHQPEMLQAIENIVSPHTMGNPMNPLIWTSKSIRKITAELLVLEYKISHEVVRQCLMELGYSLQVNKKLKKVEILLIGMHNLNTSTRLQKSLQRAAIL